MRRSVRKRISMHLSKMVLTSFYSIGIGSILLNPSCAYALPSGPHDMQNIEGITNNSATQMTINGVAGSNAVIKWNDFSVDAGEIVKFEGMNKMLNYVDSAVNPSKIYGEIDAKTVQNLYIINPSGVIFGDNSQVSTGNLFVSTRALTDEIIQNYVDNDVDPLSSPASGDTAIGKGGLKSSNILGAYDVADGDVMLLGKVEADTLTIEGNTIQIKNTKLIRNSSDTAVLTGNDVTLISDNPVEVGYEVKKLEDLTTEEVAGLESDIEAGLRRKYQDDNPNNDEMYKKGGVKLSEDQWVEEYKDDYLTYLSKTTLTEGGTPQTKSVPLYFFADKYEQLKHEDPSSLRITTETKDQNPENIASVFANSGEALGYNIKKLDQTSAGDIVNYRLVSNAYDLQSLNKSLYKGLFDDKHYDYYNDLDSLPLYQPWKTGTNYTATANGKYMLKNDIDISGISDFEPINKGGVNGSIYYFNDPPSLDFLDKFKDGLNGMSHAITMGSNQTSPLYIYYNGDMKNIRFYGKAGETSPGVISNLTSLLFLDSPYGKLMEHYFKNIKLNGGTGAKSSYGLTKEINSGGSYSLSLFDFENIESDIMINNTDDNAGMIAGYVSYNTPDDYTSNSLIIGNSINKNSITSSYYAGGLIGEIEYASRVLITNSANEGNITSTSSDGNAGGLIGSLFEDGGISNFVIQNSYNGGNAQITGDSSGGLIGMIDDQSLYEPGAKALTIEQSFNLGKISGTKASGGLIGFIDTRYGGVADFSIIDSYNKGYISANQHTGGIAGTFYGNIENVYNSGNVSLTASTTPFSDPYDWFASGPSAGGIVGKIIINPTTIKNSYNEGNISGSYNVGLNSTTGYFPVDPESGTEYFPIQFGGIVGSGILSPQSINLYNYGDITKATGTSTGSVPVKSVYGGISGDVDDPADPITQNFKWVTSATTDATKAMFSTSSGDSTEKVDMPKSDIYNLWSIDKDGSSLDKTWRVYEGHEDTNESNPLLTTFLRPLIIDYTVTKPDSTDPTQTYLTGDGTDGNPYVMTVKDISHVKIASVDTSYEDGEVKEGSLETGQWRYPTLKTNKAGNSLGLSTTEGNTDSVELWTSSQFGYNIQLRQGDRNVLSTDYPSSATDLVNKVFLTTETIPTPPPVTPPATDTDPTPPPVTPPATDPDPTPPPVTPPATDPDPTPPPVIPPATDPDPTPPPVTPPATDPDPTPPPVTPLPVPNNPTPAEQKEIKDAFGGIVFTINEDEVGKQTKTISISVEFPFQKGKYSDLDNETHILISGQDVSSNALADNVLSNDYATEFVSPHNMQNSIVEEPVSESQQSYSYSYVSNRQPNGQPKMQAQYKDSLISVDGLNENNASDPIENNVGSNLNTDTSTTSMDNNTITSDDNEQEPDE